MAPPDNAIADLYLEPFGDFVGARDALAKRLRSEGDADAAEQVRALRKPSRVAWAIDQVSGREPGLRDTLLSAGAALREAQERLVAGKGSSSDAVREAAGREREAVEAALEAVGAAAAQSGSALSAAAQERARQTLHAVALDADVRAEFEGHRLEGEHEAAGLGGFGLGADAPAPARPTKRRGGAGPAKNGEREGAKQRREQLKAAKAEARALEKRERGAQREAEAAGQAAERAQRDLERATEALEAARSEAEAARGRADALGEGSA